MKRNIGIKIYMFIIMGTIISDMIYYYPLREELFGNEGLLTIKRNILTPLFQLKGALSLYILFLIFSCLVYLFYAKLRFYSLSAVYTLWFLLLERNTFILDSSTEIISRTVPFVIILHFFQTFFSNQKSFKLISRLMPFGVMLQICLFYLFSFLSKIDDTVWINGTATYYTLRIDAYLMNDVNLALTKSAFFVYCSTYFTLLVELLFPFLVWFKRTKFIILAAGALLHIGIYLLMRIEDFSWVMIGSYFVFITDNEYKKWLGRKLSSFFYAYSLVKSKKLTLTS